MSQDLKARVSKTLNVGSRSYEIFSLKTLQELGHPELKKMPKSLKILLENLLRKMDGLNVTEDDVKAVFNWREKSRVAKEIAFSPARVLMQDFTGVPAVVDLATMRDAVVKLGGDPSRINPLSPVDLVIDHSVMVEHYGTADAFKKNVEIEYDRNKERYSFLRWGQKAFRNFRVVPPGTGICHQVNLEYLAQVVWTSEGADKGKVTAYPDTLVGTDSHTTMVNGLSVLGWGVGGIEAEAAMLGQSISMLIPDVVGFKLRGKLQEGTTATDLVLTVTQMLRKKGVVGKFVEFFGPGLKELSLADRATLANMAPEYGATCGFFPIDEETLNYLRLTSRENERIDLVKAYAQEQGLWREDADETELVFNDVMELDLGDVTPCLAGPKRPQDKILLKDLASGFPEMLQTQYKREKEILPVAVEGTSYSLKDGDVVIAAITSCTNTSNPSVLLAAGLLARKARERGLETKAWVKTSLAPGSQVVTDYLNKTGLQTDLDALGFQLVGYGCTTCIGNSGPLNDNISKAIAKGDLVACSVLSGNRNFEGRVSPDVKANFLASPPLVVAYALAGNMNVDLYKDSLGKDKNGKDVFLKDIWPSNKEISDLVAKYVTPEMFRTRYSNVFLGDSEWQNIKVKEGLTYEWDPKSTFIKKAPYFDGMTKEAGKTFHEIFKARMLLLLGDSVTTDHISPAGDISLKSPAGVYLQERGIAKYDFNSYGARRGNHEVMMRGTFANIRIKNEMLGGVEGALSLHHPSHTQGSVYDVAMKYAEEKTPLVVMAGKEYGTGSSRDWAGKGPSLLGIKACVAESFERIHRSNLIGMGVFPLQYPEGVSRKSLGLTGKESFDFSGFAKEMSPGMKVKCKITYEDGRVEELELLSRIDTFNEVEYFRNGGILHYVLRDILKRA